MINYISDVSKVYYYFARKNKQRVSAPVLSRQLIRNEVKECIGCVTQLHWPAQFAKTATIRPIKTRRTTRIVWNSTSTASSAKSIRRIKRRSNSFLRVQDCEDVN